MINEVNEKNVAFILNASPNQEGKLDDNIIERYVEIGKEYVKMPELNTLPDKWMVR